MLAQPVVVEQVSGQGGSYENIWILERGLFGVGSRGEAGQQGGTEIDRLEMEGESTEQ